MKKPKCKICDAPANRSGELSIALPDWEGWSIDLDTKVALCNEHAKHVMPILILNNLQLEGAHGI